MGNMNQTQCAVNTDRPLPKTSSTETRNFSIEKERFIKPKGSVHNFRPLKLRQHPVPPRYLIHWASRMNELKRMLDGVLESVIFRVYLNIRNLGLMVCFQMLYKRSILM